jgi:Fe-S-cluster containining protein
MSSLLTLKQQLLLLLLFIVHCCLLQVDALSNSSSRFLRKLRGNIPQKYPFALPWYEDGLNFSCTGCGKCCKVNGDVWLAPEEVSKIMEHLDYTSRSQFRTDFIKAEILQDDDEDKSWMCLKRKEGACIFLGDDKKCKIYEHRPVQCQTYPFWPSLLSDPAAWEEEAVVPDDVLIDEGSTQRHWSQEEGGCEGITITATITETNDIASNENAEVVQREEITTKMRQAKKHWLRFPIDEIKTSTWYL